MARLNRGFFIDNFEATRRDSLASFKTGRLLFFGEPKGKGEIMETSKEIEILEKLLKEPVKYLNHSRAVSFLEKNSFPYKLNQTYYGPEMRKKIKSLPNGLLYFFSTDMNYEGSAYVQEFKSGSPISGVRNVVKQLIIDLKGFSGIL